MSQFVNYNKRGVSLPKGCKDLVDVLKQEGSGVAKGGKHEEELGKFSDRVFVGSGAWSLEF